MIAHSFRGAVFGPAQALHGATFVIDAAFMAETLDANGIVIDIGRAHEALKAALAPLNYCNLDSLPALNSANSVAEAGCWEFWSPAGCRDCNSWAAREPPLALRAPARYR